MLCLVGLDPHAEVRGSVIATELMLATPRAARARTTA
ncbi:hypothetical protein LINGRAHAP2_LOCUS10797 [Linum grandiflorum]